MRFIDREKMPPLQILSSDRAMVARADMQDFIERTRDKGSSRRAPQHGWLDGAVSVQKEMRALFCENCAYCESATVSVTKDAAESEMSKRGCISRHRPPALAQDQSGGTELLAYSWLTYEWDNLLWLCEDCSRRKGNQFFVAGRRGSPGTSIPLLRLQENELLLDPCYHAPDKHLVFGVDGNVNWSSPKGQATVEVLELNRDSLVSSRRRIIEHIALQLQRATLATEDGQLVPRSMPGGGEGKRFPQHAGAATQAILSFARYRGMEFETAQGFLDLLGNQTLRDRQGFIADLLNQSISPLQFETLPAPPVERHRSQPSRLPDVQSLPNALHPITRVEISNFKALRDIAFDLPESVEDPEQSPCMLLLGENATGKSSVLEAMALAIIGSKETTELDGIAKDLDISPDGLIHRPDPYVWSTTMDSMRVELAFRDSQTPVVLEAQAGDAAFSGSDRCAKVVLGYGPRRFFTSARTRRLRAPAHRVRSMFDPMDMIANPIHWLSGLNDPQFFAAARALREVLMLSNEDDFERDDAPDTPGHVYIRQGSQRVAMQDLSVGFKSVIAMVCDIIRELLYHFDNLEFASAVVFIDEIETHLHPRWKMQIMTLLRRAFPKVQFIVTTHDPLCLRGMYDGEVFVLQRSGETDRVERVKDLPSIRGMRAEQILTSEFFGLGSTDPETDARLLRYNRLASRIEDLSPEEQAEMERLRKHLDEGMVIGTTLREQAYAEALKDRTNARSVAPTQAPSPRRAALKTEFSNLFTQRSDP